VGNLTKKDVPTVKDLDDYLLEYSHGLKDKVDEQ
jgi:hypothetical protein